MTIEELATRIAGHLEPGLERALELLNVEEAEVLAACGVLDAAAPWTPRQRFALRLYLNERASEHSAIERACRNAATLLADAVLCSLTEDKERGDTVRAILGKVDGSLLAPGGPQKVRDLVSR